MTKVLVLGSSHVGALREAAEPFRRVFPRVEIDYFATPGPMFRAGRVTDAGFFAPRRTSEKDAAIVAKVNDGKETCDLGGYDQILCVGHRPLFVSTTALLSAHDLLEGSRTGKPHLVSRSFVLAVAHEQLDQFVSEIQWRYGTKHPFVFTLAPYPSEGIAARVASYPDAQPIVDYMTHADTPAIFADWLSIYETGLRAAGYDVLHQPEITVAGPCLTKKRYAEGALHADGSALGWADHRHMNAEFGFEMLSALAQEKLNIAPAVSAA